MSNIPDRNVLKDITPFRFWCQKVLPLTYDDSLSYYELLCKVVDHLNNATEDILLLDDDIAKMYTFVDEYFTNLDVQNEINEKLDSMASDGSLEAVVQPVVSAEVAEWLEQHVSPTAPAIDSSLTIAGAGADAKKTGEIRENVVDFNSWNILQDMLKTNENRNGVYYEWTGDTCYVHGTAISESYSNLINSADSLPVGVKADTEYNVHFSGENVLLNVLWYSGETVVQNDYFTGNRSVKSPASVSGIIVRLLVASGVTANERVSDIYITTGNGNDIIKTFINPIHYKGTIPTGLSIDDAEGETIYVTPSDTVGIPLAINGFIQTIGYDTGFKYQIWTAASNGRPYYRYKEPNASYTNWVDMATRLSELVKNIYYAESLPSGSNLNDAPPNSVSVDGGNCVNSPQANFAGYVYTMGDITKGACVQYWVQYGNGTTYYRRGLNNTWYDWINMSAGSGGAGGNPYATMLSVGNSILTGAVYTNGTYNRLATYGNAPYSVVATALDVMQENERHILKSSTGILYDAGEGNFLNTIKGIDLANYDYLLTHFWLADMENYQIGTLNSVAGDGTLVGAILEILNYMRSSNGRCQLLLASVPPSSYTIYGNNVFTGNYGNGSSIADLDLIMKQLAKREHFRYADWQDLNMSYYYQNYTDGNNVHLNSEAGYRTLGEYLASKFVSTKGGDTTEVVNVKEVKAVQFTGTTSASGNVNYQFAGQKKVYVLGAYATRGDTDVFPYPATNTGLAGNYSWWFSVRAATPEHAPVASTEVTITVLYVEV